MTNLRRALVTLTLLFALAAPTLAGNIHAGVVDPPPSAQPTQTDGSTSSDATAEQSSTPDSALGSAVEAALSVVQSILSII